MTTIEKNIRVCKRCKESKLRIMEGYYPNKKNKRWVQEDGKEWNGNTCGTCHQTKVKEVMKKGRKK